MAEKKNEILEEQRRAREEFLRLKRMQNGEIEPEAKPSELALEPKTFGEKVKNYWYHYKLHTILIGFLTIVLAILIVQCTTRVKYDLRIMYFAYKPTIDAQTNTMEDYFEKYASDINDDGEVNVSVVNCSVSDNSKDTSQMTIFSKVQSILAAEKTMVLYVVDDKAIKYFEDALNVSIFAEGPYDLGEDFYKSCTIEGIELPEGLKIGLRVIDGTTFKDDKEAEAAFSHGKEVIEKIKKQNG